MSPGAAATTESPFDGDSDSVYNSKDTALEPDESVHADSFDESSGPNLPPPSKMEGFALREWRRLNAIRLAEKEKEEKTMLQQIIEEADEFKREFYRKRQTAIQNRTASNREKQKQYLDNQERFHAEADKSYWKAIAELIPYEVATIEKKGKKDKDKDKQPTITVITGPKPGRPTDMSRMRQVLVKLKHNPPPHMKPKPSQDTRTEPTPAVTGKAGTSSAASASQKVAVGKGSTSKPL